MPTNNSVTIDLNRSEFANVFEQESVIHVREFEYVINLIDNQISKIKSSDQSINGYVDSGAIAVFGERGTGKTSFVKSLLHHYKKTNDVVTLRLIDPTRIEEKGHIFLLLVSIINDLIETHLKNNEYDPNSSDYAHRKEWKLMLQKLAKGLPSLENIGGNYSSDSWQSERFIMEEGFKNVSAALNLENNFHALIKKALEILKGKVFLVMFDDIDVDSSKGWIVLETIRKYLTTPQIITVITGDISLYSYIVRRQQLEYIKYDKRNSVICDEEYIKKLLDGLEYQYFIKVIQPARTISLQSIYANINNRIKYNLTSLHHADKGSAEIGVFYSNILRYAGIYKTSQSGVLLNFILSLPIRTQINMLRAFDNSGNIDFNIINVFANLLYEKGVDVGLAKHSSQDFVSEVNKFLSKYKLYNSVDLMPVKDKSLGTCLLAFLFMYSTYLRNSVYLLFDYGVRTCFAFSSYIDEVAQESISTFSQEFRNSTLKDIVLYSNIQEIIHNKRPIGCIPLLGFASKAKKSSDGRLDTLLNGKTLIQQILLCIPVVYYTPTDKNRSQLFYSPLALFASIGDIIKASDDGDIVDLLKSYMDICGCFVDVKNSILNKSRTELSKLYDENILKQEQNLYDFASDIKHWALYGKHLIDGNEKTYYCGSSISIADIVKKICNAVELIIQNNGNCDNIFNLSISAFFNLLLVEELNFFGHEKNIRDIRTNNIVTSNRLFLDKIKKCGPELRMIAPLTYWLCNCPILIPFYDHSFYAELCNMSDVFPMYHHYDIVHIGETLSKLKIRTDEQSSSNNMLPKFYGQKGKVKEMKSYLKGLDIDIDNIPGLSDADAISLLQPHFSNKIGDKNIIAFKKYLRDEPQK